MYPPRLGGSDEPRAIRVHRATAPGPDITLWTFRDCVAARVALLAEEAAWRFGPLDRLAFAESLLRSHVGRTAVKAVLLSMREQPDEVDEDECEGASREA